MVISLRHLEEKIPASPLLWPPLRTNKQKSMKQKYSTVCISYQLFPPVYETTSLSLSLKDIYFLLLSWSPRVLKCCWFLGNASVLWPTMKMSAAANASWPGMCLEFMMERDRSHSVNMALLPRFLSKYLEERKSHNRRATWYTDIKCNYILEFYKAKVSWTFK